MTSLNIVSHPDDDLLFLNPDIVEEVSSHKGMTYVAYLTWGDDGRGEDYVRCRRRATLSAYKAMGATVYDYAYREFWIRSNSFRSGDVYGSLYQMWHDHAVQVKDFNMHTWDYAALLGSIQDLIGYVKPDLIRTQDPDAEPAIDHDEPQLDHIDHIYTAKFVQEAAKQFPNIPVYAYEGYPIRTKASNVDAEGTEKKTLMWRAYQAVDTSVAGEIWDVAMSRCYKRQIQ